MWKSFVISLFIGLTVINAQSSIVVDEKNHLEWEDNRERNIEIWKLANGYCQQLQLAGHEDWRLPTKDELVALSKDGHLKKQFQHMRDNIFWTSDNGLFEATTVYSGNGFATSSDNCEKYAAICVRNVK